MRYIHLNTENVMTHFDTMLKFGCGPNFVLNRPKMFEAMICNQGITFWFRFWLTFCLHPSCYDMCMIYRHWPIMTTYINECVHKQFLQGTVQSRSHYCLERVIRPMLVISSKKKLIQGIKMKNPEVQLKELVTKCLGFAFGCALCDVFYKWQFAPTLTNDNEEYWTIPEDYLKPNFKPKLLETFLVEQWNEELLSLLGVKAEQVPWIKNLLNTKEAKVEVFKEMSDCVDEYYDCKLIQETSDFMKRIRNGRKKHIREIDETPQAFKRLSTAKNKTTVGGTEKMEKKYKNKDRSSKPIVRIHQCTYCFAYESKSKPKFKKCKRCVDKLWPEPRYYCDANCQVSDWYQFHHDEHRVVEEFQLKTELRTEQENETKMKINV